MKYLRRLVWITPGEKIHPMMYVGMWLTFVFGVGFTFFGWSDSVQSSLLYQITEIETFQHATSIFGVIFFVAVLLALLNIVFRKKFFGYAAGFVGVNAWFVAILFYLLSGLYFQAVASLSNLGFWMWHQHRIRRYYRLHLLDPGTNAYLL